MIDRFNSNLELVEEIKLLVSLLGEFDVAERIAAINEVRAEIHKVSPFNAEPVDFVRWVSAESVKANDYNPNSVAPPEMRLQRRTCPSTGRLAAAAPSAATGRPAGW